MSISSRRIFLAINGTSPTPINFSYATHLGRIVPPHTELESHWDILSAEIAECNPKIIVCLGAVATKWMMEKAAIEYHSADCHRGMPVGYYGKSLLFSSTHPAAGVHSPDSMKFLMADFTNLATMMRIINRGERPTLPVDIFEDATDYRRLRTIEDIADVWDDTAPFISIDTEGTRKHPIMLQFSFYEGTGYAIFAEDKNLVDYFRFRLLQYLVRNSIHGFLNGDRTAHVAYLHNALYDIGVMSTMDIHLPDGSWIDTMVLAFLLGTEPLGLKPLAFRLRGMKMASYEEQIGPRNEEMALNYLIEASLHTWPDAQEMLIRDGGEFRLYKPQSIGVRINNILRDWAEQEIKIEHVTHIECEETNKAGVTKVKRHTHDWYEKHHDGACPPGCHEVKVERERPVDIRDRWDKKGEAIEMDAEKEEDDYRPEYDTTGQMLRAPVEEMLGRMPEATLLDIPEEQAVGYACRDSDATTRVGPLLLSRVKTLDLDLPLRIDMGIQGILARMMQVGIPADRDHFIQFGKDCRARMDQIEFDIHNLVGRTINLASGPQLSYLLFNELKLPSQRWTKSHDQLAVDKKALEPLRYMHPVIPLVLEWSETETLLNNFAQVLPAKMDAAGYLHCKIGMTRIPSGRLNTSDPNLMAMPARSEIGETIRRGFKAPKGFKFVTVDACIVEGEGVDTPHGDTPIEILERGDIVYGFRDKKPCCTKVVAKRYSGERECLRVHLDNGKAFEVSLDHKVARLVDGRKGQWEEVRADQLEPGTRILSLHRTLNNQGRVALYGHSSFSYVMEHIAVAEAAHGPRPQGQDVHHVDEIPSHNWPENLEYKDASLHRRDHSRVNYAKQDHDLRIARLQWALKYERRSYAGEGNPNFGKFQASPRKCDQCQGEYYRPPTRLGRFCSQSCATTYKNLHSKYYSSNGTTKQCLTCKKDFYCPPSKPGRKFCSKPCAGIARRKGLNAKVVKIERIGVRRTWQIEVAESTHIFALASGAYVSNSQIELRALAFLSLDPKLVGIFNRGHDCHTDCGAFLMGIPYEEMVQRLKSSDPIIHRRAKEKRAAGKTINFGIVNRMTGIGLLDQLKLQGLAANPWMPNMQYLDPTTDKKGKPAYSTSQNNKGEPCRFIALSGGLSGVREPAWDFAPGAITEDQDIIWEASGEGWTADKGEAFITSWMKNYSGVPAWHEGLFAEVLRSGYVRDLFGRLRYSPELRSSISKIKAAGEKQVANFPIQTSAINIIKICMRLIWETLVNDWWPRGIHIEPCLNVHDEILMLCEDAAVDEVGPALKGIMGVGITEELHRMGFDLPVPLDGAWGSGESWGSIDK